MTEYITKEQAELLAKKHAREVYKSEGVYDAMTVPLAALPALCNAAIQHYKDSQPKPASVEEIMGLADKYRDLTVGHGTAKARAELHQAITQQAEALAQALDEADDWHHANNMRKKAEAERDQLRAQLAALQYNGELPEPIWMPLPAAPSPKEGA
jgi:methyl coenzyme M reductase beta subunit